ncbi:alpha/beta hydrolase [Streptacidiphilus jiangxiensis]|uniref:Alpha/beta hydrolase n=1 Tax=Streptacidiphilus jiangxiensis TaxID=235985 RepID=A0A1H7REM2_STRJI|nr:alpha/beta hydrolase [Streptacidiphilus jiangxiensis]SEL58529.1 Alpha/beta hydrolase [Streptacidiphilus jiangxiensis]
MVTYAELLDARFDALTHAGDAYDALSKAFGAHIDEVTAVSTGRQQNWTGLAAFEAATALTTQNNDLTAAHEEMLGVGVILHEAVASFAAAQSELTAALEAARAANCTVAPDGTVTGPTMSEAEHHDRDAQEQQGVLVEQIAMRIGKAVQAADKADAQFAGRLNALAAHGRDGSGLSISTANADLGAQTAATKSGPKAVNAWWKGLSAAEQQTFIHDQPGVYGNLDGIPAVARDQANRIYLGQLIDQYEGGSQPLSDIDNRKLQGFLAIQSRLDHYQGMNPPLLLLGVNDQGQGHGILSYGNPDTAQNVSVYVPGLGTTLADVAGGDGDRALQLWEAAHGVRGAGTTASVVWLGYDPPPGLGGVDPATTEVMSSERAASGAPTYDQFLTGIRTTHNGSVHLTALGHSYGSYLVGLAAQQPGGTGANDIILIGSPGTGASNAAQLGVGPGHVWVGAAANDPVTHMPSKLDVGAVGLLGAQIGGAVASSDPHQLWFGTDPASAQYGAQRFDVANGPAASFDSHSAYFNERSNSMLNMAHIVTGTGPVNLEPPR